MNRAKRMMLYLLFTIMNKEFSSKLFNSLGQNSQNLTTLVFDNVTSLPPYSPVLMLLESNTIQLSQHLDGGHWGSATSSQGPNMTKALGTRWGSKGPERTRFCLDI